MYISLQISRLLYENEILATSYIKISKLKNNNWYNFIDPL